MSENNDKGAVQKLNAIKLLAMDVDGVLTDGGIILDAEGAEVKRFSVLDGLGLQLVMLSGMPVAWISGRKSTVVEIRATEIGITHLVQDCRNKSKALEDLIARYELDIEEVAYIGDDLNDLPAFRMAGVRFAPANAVAEIIGSADFVTEKAGGAGAVREVCDVILKAQDAWTEAVTVYLAKLISPDA